MNPGTSGLVFAFQFARVGLGVGIIAASLTAYTDYVTVLTITNSAFVAALNPPCKRYTIERAAHVGVDLNIWPLPFPLGLYQKEV
jgi:hypothetical protein